MGAKENGGCTLAAQDYWQDMTKKTTAEIEENAKKILDDFAQSLKRVEGKEFELYSESIENMRIPLNPPEEGLKEKMIVNFPKTKGGEPLMEKKGW